MHMTMMKSSMKSSMIPKLPRQSLRLPLCLRLIRSGQTSPARMSQLMALKINWVNMVQTSKTRPIAPVAAKT